MWCLMPNSTSIEGPHDFSGDVAHWATQLFNKLKRPAVPDSFWKSLKQAIAMCLLGSTCLHVLAGYAGISGHVIICRRSCAQSGSGLFASHFLLHDVAFRIHQWCQATPCGGSWRMCTSRMSGKNALRPWLFSLITRYCFTLCKELVSPDSYLCIYNKKCS